MLTHLIPRLRGDRSTTKTNRMRRAPVAVIAVLFTLGGPGQAVAAPTTATVTGGALSITVPGSAGSLGSITNTVSGGVISGPLGQVQVNDARSAAAGSGWVASVISTAFTPSSGPTIGAAAVGYVAGPTTKVAAVQFKVQP